MKKSWYMKGKIGGRLTQKEAGRYSAAAHSF